MSLNPGLIAIVRNIQFSQGRWLSRSRKCGAASIYTQSAFKHFSDTHQNDKRFFHAGILARNAEDTSQNASSSSNDPNSSTVPPKGGRVWPKFLLTLFVATTTGLLYFGRPFPEDDKTKPSGSVQDIVKAYFSRSRERYREFLKKFADPSSPMLLPSPTPGTPQPPYTLVIDLDQTLVHSVWSRDHGWRVAKRPGADFLLSYLSQFYEVVIISSQHVTYADPVITKLDPYGFVSYRLYRDATKYVKGVHKKDLSHLNRDLSKVILIDDNPKEADMQKENLITVKKWEADDARDRELFDLIPFLEALALSNVDDVRTVLKAYEGKNIGKHFREKNEERLLKLKEANARKQRGFLSKIAPIDNSIESLDFDQIQERKYKQFLIQKELMIQKMEKHMKEQKEKENQEKLLKETQKEAQKESST